MLIPDEIRLCTVFLYVQSTNGKEPAGTAFFLSVPWEGAEDGRWDYLVTARHVIEDIREKGEDSQVWLRVNAKSGGTRFLETPLKYWDSHPDDSVDLAMAHVILGPDYEHRAVPLEMVLTPTIIKEHRIEPGCDLFMTGLFFHHRGEQRNIPIIRVGNIAAMPEERLPVKLRGKVQLMEAYLIESRSFGGLSGSPVFAWKSPGVFFLLGVVFAHYHAFEDLRVILEEEAINMGIAIVTPVEKLVEMVNAPERVAVRKAKADEPK